jgi:hypothetical protein
MLRRKKAEPKTPHFLYLNLDIVAWSQEEKCRLKYVMPTQYQKTKGTVFPVRLQRVVMCLIKDPWSKVEKW